MPDTAIKATGIVKWFGEGEATVACNPAADHTFR